MRGAVDVAEPTQRPWGLAAWRGWAPLVPVLVLILFLFRDTFGAMVGIWARSDTFAHAFLVPPIALWLSWRMRESLRTLPVRAAPRWLMAVVAACLLWLVGYVASAAAAMQFAAVALLVISVPLLLGPAVARALAFPLLFLFFCVPFGDFLVEPMMEGTADFTVQALRLSGIPVYREGLQFVIPSGNWSVVEACSGVRYLIASFMVGTLFASLHYRSRRRQLLMVALSLVVPVIANWLRAYMIVMLGHYSGNKLAVDADHLIYGWVFFGVVILLMFSIGARFAEDGLPAPAGAATKAVAGPPVPGQPTRHAMAGSPWTAAGAATLLMLLAQAAAWALQQPSGAAPQLSLPAQLPGGWAVSNEPLTAWTPRFQNPSAVATLTYRRPDGSAVAVWVGHYRDQGQERKLVTSTNVMVEYKSVDWLAVPTAARPVRTGVDGAAMVQMRSTVLRTPADPKTTPRQRLLVMQVYRVGDRFITEDALAHLHIALRRLLGRGDDGAVLMFYAETDEAGHGDAVLQSFVADHLAAIAAPVDAASRQR